MPVNAETGAFTVEGFCSAHKISRAQYYILLKNGTAPRSYLIGKRRYISHDAAREWQRSLEDISSAAP